MTDFNKAKLLKLAVLTSLVGLGCADNASLVDAKFSSPSALVVAGPDNNRLFVANAGSGSLQVLRLEDKLEEMTFEESQLVYFPLEIPLGNEKGYPSHLAASKAGAYVLVLDSANASIHLIDAATLEKEQGEGVYKLREILEAPVGSPVSPASLVSGRQECGSGCLGEFYVSFKETGTVVGLRLAEAGAQGPSLSKFTTATIPGSPGELAVAPGQTKLFAADASEALLYQFALTDGELELTATIPMGAVAGSLSVSGDGQFLVAARPQLLDVIVFRLDDPSGDPALVDLNAEAAPSLTCLDPCSPQEDGSLCVGHHPGATALCTEEGGLGLTDSGYEGIYLGATPSKVLALGGSLGHTSLVVPCFESDEQKEPLERVYSEYALVAMLDGSIQMLGLKLNDEAEAEAFAPELASFGWCRSAALQIQGSESVLVSDETVESDLGLVAKALGPCPGFPDRNRFECLTSLTSDREIAGVGEQEDFGVVNLAGRTSLFGVYLDWEGPVSSELIQDEGGQVTEDGNFSDVKLNLGNFGGAIQAGDILEITTDLLWEDTECQAALGDNAGLLCGVERRIVEVPTNDAPVLVLDSPLPLACFRGGGRIGYRIRMGDSFLVKTTLGASYRLRPGERFGPGGHTALNETILFSIRETENGSDSALSGCERYSPEGLLNSDPESVFRRSVGNAVTDPVNNTYGFLVKDAHYDSAGVGFNDTNQLYVRTGLRLVLNNSRYVLEGTAGRLPSSMIVSSYRGADKEPVIFTSYAGTDGVLAFEPYYPEMNADRFRDPAYFLLE